MNALHADVLSTQCRRYAELIGKFSKEIAEDSKLSDEERGLIHSKLEWVVVELSNLANEIHDRYRYLRNPGDLPK